MDYSKHKDRKPEKTIDKIKGILSSLDIETEVTWVDNSINGCFSNRVSIKDTNIGTNGKGTTETYCMASAYGELMERLQCDCFYLGEQSPEDRGAYGFVSDPFERKMSISECCQMENPFFTHLFKKSNVTKESDKRSFLEMWDFNDDGKLELMPCVSLGKKEIQYISQGIAITLYGSNGMCAGNTTEEALVQGMAEVFERYVTSQMIRQRITPPSIPNHIIEGISSLYNMKSQIEESGRFKLIAKDCSMGRGIPAVGLIIMDKKTGKFGFKFAAHMSLAVALERCFTEAMQGKNIESFANMCDIGTEVQVQNRENVINHFKIGSAFFYPEVLFSQPDYSYSIEHFDDSLSNKEMLKRMLDTGMKLGNDILIRDCSFLGVPAYQIIIPGISEMYEFDDKRPKEISTLQKNIKGFEKTAELKKLDLERVVRYIRFKRYSAIERDISFVTGKPLSQLFPSVTDATGFLEAICLFDLGKTDEATACFGNLSLGAKVMESYEEVRYYRCILKFLSLGDHETTRVLFGKTLAERVLYEFGEPGKATAKLIPHFDCFDCSSCESANTICHYPKTSEVIRKMKKGRKEAGITQEELLECLRGIV